MQTIHRAVEQEIIKESQNDLTIDYNESGRLTLRFLPDEKPTVGFEDLLINFTVNESNHIIDFCSKISRLGFKYDYEKERGKQDAQRS